MWNALLPGTKQNLRIICMQLVASNQPFQPFDCIHHNSVACCFSTICLLATCIWQKWRIMCFVAAPLSSCMSCFCHCLFCFLFSIIFDFFLQLDLLQAKSTSTCSAKNPKLGARVRVCLRFWTPALSLSVHTTLYFSVRRNTTGMPCPGHYAVLNTFASVLQNLAESLLYRGNLHKSLSISNTLIQSLFNDRLIACCKAAVWSWCKGTSGLWDGGTAASLPNDA